MKSQFLRSAILLGSLIAISEYAFSEESQKPTSELKLSQDLVDLLRAEMRELSVGVQGMSLSIATANWGSIQDTGAKIRASYIMEKKLTSAQAAELAAALPEKFKQIDASFHKRAEKLSEAAAARDAELVIFQYARLLESCAACHSEFATSRFPDFSLASPQAHHH